MNATYSHSNRAQEKKWGRSSVSRVQSRNYQRTFLLNPTKIGPVKEITNNSLVMPRKSTYFYPKVLSGLVSSKIEPHEIAQVY
jgi:hypothetical protein